MQSEFALTVKDVLKRPLFQKARVVAGKNGLDRKVRWVHILEISDVESLIHGEEMILATGVGLHQNGVSKTAYLKKLIQYGASCLCIELGQYFDRVSEEMIEIADRHHFPIIVFHETVRFIDITQDLHTLIINRHYKMLADLELISRELQRLTLTSQGTHNILKLLQKSTKTQVIYLPLQGNPVYVPMLHTEEQHQYLEFLYNKVNQIGNSHSFNETSFQLTEFGKTFLLQPVGALGQTWGYLILVFDDRPPEEFDSLVLDRTALSLAQDILRRRLIEERRQHTENLWVDDLIHGRLKSEEQIKSLLGQRFRDLTNVSYRVCLIEMVNRYVEEFPAVGRGIDDEQDAMQLHLALLIRSAFEKFSFHPLITSKHNLFIVIALDLHPQQSQKERLLRVFHLIQNARDKKVKEFRFNFGVGRCYKKFLDAPMGFQEAKEALRMNNLFQNSLGPFYEELGVYRILLNLENESVLQSFVNDYLGPLIEHDRLKGGELVRTLKTYLDHHGSKQMAAQKLFVTRQTLYHRLEKIEELLGENFMLPERRLALELAIRAYQLLNQGKL